MLRNIVDEYNKGRRDFTGLDLSKAFLGSAFLSAAYLGKANLSGAYLSAAFLGGANLEGADFSAANLSGAYLGRANLGGADFGEAFLGGADFSGALLGGAELDRANNLDGELGAAYVGINPADIPIIENIDAAILEGIERGGTLDMNSWHGPENHWCGTTHCRAGWAVHLGGEKGKTLQDRIGTHLAGLLIYEASRPGIPAPWFFDTTENALADIRKCAAEHK